MKENQNVTVQLIEDFDGGVFVQRLDAALKACALGVTTEGRDGEVVIKLKLKQIGSSSQVNVVHSIKSMHPTAKGRVVEEATTSTPVHVGKGGRMTLFPETQPRLFADEPRPAGDQY